MTEINLAAPKTKKQIEKYIIRELVVKYKKFRKVKSVYLRSSKEVYDWYKGLINEQLEHFYSVFLNSKNEIIAVSHDFTGGITSSSVYPGIIVRNCILVGASACIFVHNHPSGVPEPSDSDREITKKLVEGLKLLEVKVLDHIVIGDKKYFSFADNGLIIK